MIGTPLKFIKSVGSKADLPAPDTNGLVAYDNERGVMYISSDGSWIEMSNSGNEKVWDDITFLEGSSIRTRLICYRLLQNKASSTSLLSSAVIGDKSFSLLRFMPDTYIHYEVVYKSDEDLGINEVKVMLHDITHKECAKVLVDSGCTIDEALQKFFDNLINIDESVKTVYRSLLGSVRSATISDLIDSRNALSNDTINNYIL